MNQLILGLRLPLLPLLILTVATASFAQTTEQREIAAMTFQSGREFQVPMTGTPRYPKLRGAMKVKFSQKSGTKVDLSVSELPPILSLGGLYMSWVVWTIGSDGRVENVGNLKSSLRGSNDGGVDFSTSLSTFAVVVSAEPFAEVRRPGPVVVLESNPHGSEERHSIVSKRVTYPINQSDFYRDDQVPGSDEKAYRKQRPELLRAERARRYAQYAGADSLASELYKKLVEKLESLKDDISKDLNDKILGQRTVEIEELAADAEAEAEKVRASRQVQQAEKRRANDQKKIEEDRAYFESAARERADALETEKEKRAAADRRAENLQNSLSSLEKEHTAALEELKSVKERLAAAEKERILAEKRLKTIADLPMMRVHLRAWFPVTDLSGGIGLKLSDTIWRRGTTDVDPIQLGRLEDPFRRIAAWDEFRVVISIKGAGPGVVETAEGRYRSLSYHLKQLGIDPSRISFDGPSFTEPAVDLKPSKKPAVWTKTEIRLELVRPDNPKSVS